MLIICTNYFYYGNGLDMAYITNHSIYSIFIYISKINSSRSYPEHDSVLIVNVHGAGLNPISLTVWHCDRNIADTVPVRDQLLEHWSTWAGDLCIPLVSSLGWWSCYRILPECSEWVQLYVMSAWVSDAGCKGRQGFSNALMASTQVLRGCWEKLEKQTVKELKQTQITSHNPLLKS